MSFTEYKTNLRRRSRSYWIRLFLFVVLGSVVANWIGKWDVWIDLRYKIYQSLQGMLPGKRHVQSTVLVLIQDEEYWKGILEQRAPIKRDYLAKLVRVLDGDDAAIIAIDFDLRSPMPSGANVGRDSYFSETTDLVRAVHEVSQNRPVVLPKTVAVDDDGECVAESDVVDGFDLGTNVRRGYIVLPREIRQIPLTLSLKDKSSMDSLSEAIVKASDADALEGVPTPSDEPTFAGFLRKDEFRNRKGHRQVVVDSGELLRSPEQFKDDIRSKIVIIGGAWHTRAYGRGSLVDTYYTPAGDMIGAMIHANYVEALLAGKVYRPLAGWVATIIEGVLVLLVAFVFAAEDRPRPKSLLLALLVLACALVSYVAFTNFGVFFDFLIPLLAVAFHAGLEQVLEWRDHARLYAKSELIKRAAAQSQVGLLVLAALLSCSTLQTRAAVLRDGGTIQSQSDNANSSNKKPATTNGPKKPPPPIDPNKPGGPRVTLQGLIKERNGDAIILQLSDSVELVVVLTDSTKVNQLPEPDAKQMTVSASSEAMPKPRHEEMSVAALIPGLVVQVDVTHVDQNQLVATSVRFHADDLAKAQLAQAGLRESKISDERLMELEKQAEERNAQNEAWQAQQGGITATKGAGGVYLDVKRFGDLEDYYILGELTIYFRNGKVKVERAYERQLLRLAEEAKAIAGYMIELKAYDSSAGTLGFNTKLNEERVAHVAKTLVQRGHVPLTRILAPAALGDSRQISNDKTAEERAENRRVVVRVLVSKTMAEEKRSKLTNESKAITGEPSRGKLTIENRTGVMLSVQVSGTESRAFSASPGSSSVGLRPGDYTVSVSSGCGSRVDSVHISSGSTAQEIYTCEQQ